MLTAAGVHPGGLGSQPCPHQHAHLSEAAPLSAAYHEEPLAAAADALIHASTQWG